MNVKKFTKMYKIHKYIKSDLQKKKKKVQMSFMSQTQLCLALISESLPVHL